VARSIVRLLPLGRRHDGCHTLHHRPAAYLAEVGGRVTSNSLAANRRVHNRCGRTGGQVSTPRQTPTPSTGHHLSQIP